MLKQTTENRTLNYIRQIKASVIFKLVAVFFTFLTTPILLKYLGIERFGVWSTLLTILSWALIFDLGIGNGLRNSIADSIARNCYNRASKASAVGYTLIGIISFVLWMVSNLVLIHVNWQTVFNVSSVSKQELTRTVQISMVFVALNLWLGLISALLNATQQTAKIGLLQLLANAFAFLLVLLINKTANPSLLYLAIIYGSSVLCANVVMSVWFFLNYKYLMPRPCIAKEAIAPLLTLGLRFLIIQISGLVIFTTDKILITQLIGPQYVTEYDVVFKIFSIINVAYGIISAPLWSAYTDAFSRNDIAWIRRMLANQLYIFVGVVLAVIAMAFLTRQILVMWLGTDLGVAKLLIASVAILTVITVWNNIFAIFINGTGKINLQIITAFIGAILNIPLSIFFVSYVGMGVSGVVFATSASLFIGSVLLPIQVHRMLS